MLPPDAAGRYRTAPYCPLTHANQLKPAKNVNPAVPSGRASQPFAYRQLDKINYLGQLRRYSYGRQL